MIGLLPEKQWGVRSRSALLLILSLALLFQSLISASHRHDSSAPESTSRIAAKASDPGKSPAKPSQRKSNFDDCPICRTLADGGHYVASALPAIAWTFALTLSDVSSFEQEVALNLPSHRWQSRAPPISFLN